MSTAFRRGDLLRVRPQDADDPVANAYALARVQFKRYLESPVGRVYAMCEFGEKGKPIVLRVSDLRKETE